MHFAEYQREAMRTAIYPIDQGITYTALGLASEAGEVAGKVKKIIRDKGGVFDEQSRRDIASEVADCLWYIAGLARELDIPMEHMAVSNLEKLASRQARGTLEGSGDVR